MEGQGSVATDLHSSPICAHCCKVSSESQKLMCCARCHRAHYCDQKCQKADWVFHKRVCVTAETTDATDATHAVEPCCATRTVDSSCGSRGSRGSTEIFFYDSQNVIVKDLKSRSDINGCRGTIIGSFNPKKNRWPVRVVLSADATEDVWLREANLHTEDADDPQAATKLADARRKHTALTEGGHLSIEDVWKMQNSPSCGCKSCASACGNEPGMYSAYQIDELMENGTFESESMKKDCVMDHYNHPHDFKKPSVTIMRPRKQGEKWGVAPFTPVRGGCVHLGKHGCKLPKEMTEMKGMGRVPKNCYALHCNPDLHVQFDKHSSAYEVWDTPVGRSVIERFKKMILESDPTTRVDPEFYEEEAIRVARDPKAREQHMSFSRQDSELAMLTNMMNGMAGMFESLTKLGQSRKP